MRTLFEEHEPPADVPDELPQENQLATAEWQRLVEGCAYLCKSLARKVAVKFHRLHELDQLVSDANLYCCEAACKWQPGRGVKFSTYAHAYIWRSLTRPYCEGRSKAAEYGAGDAFWGGCVDHNADDEPASVRPVNEDQAGLLRALPEPTRTIVRLFVFERLGFGEIADQVGLAVKDVRLCLRGAGVRLNAILERHHAATSLFDLAEDLEYCDESA
jgi:DNA-directed RNA polymerase specialized sigma subunit